MELSFMKINNETRSKSGTNEFDRNIFNHPNARVLLITRSHHWPMLPLRSTIATTSGFSLDTACAVDLKTPEGGTVTVKSLPSVPRSCNSLAITTSAMPTTDVIKRVGQAIV